MKKEQGITLIALVITIIVMLILVAVSVVAAINGGLIKISSDAAIEKDMKKMEEQITSAFVYDNNGKLLYATTKGNIEDLFRTKIKKSFRFLIDNYDSETGNFLLRIEVEGIRDTKYYFRITEGGVEDSSWKRNNDGGSSMEAMIGFDGNIPIIVLKTDDRTSNYTEEDAVNDINDFFQVYYYAFKSFEYIRENYNIYEMEDPEQELANLNIQDESQRQAVASLIAGISESTQIDFSGLSDNGENVDPVQYCRDKGLFESNGAQLHFNSVNEFLAYFNNHKMDYFKIAEFAKDTTWAMGSAPSEEGQAEQNAYFDLVEDIAKNNDISSVGNILNSIREFNQIDSLVGQTGYNDAKNTILPYIETERLEKAVYIAIKAGIDMLKPYGEYTQVLGLIDGTLSGYSNNMFANYHGDSQEAIQQNVLASGHDILSEYNNYIFELIAPQNQRASITYSYDNLNEGAKISADILALVGVILIQDQSENRQTLEVGENDEITLVINGENIDTKTKRVWNPAYDFMGN